MRKEIERQVEAYIREHGMIRRDDVVITGVSGGADSVCLLFVLCALRERMGFRVSACHVNHGLRGAEADADEAFVRTLCEELGVECRFFHADVELIARNRKQSCEEAGRAVRREAFETMCRENGGTKIATAHHQNDNAETVLWNMARGTGLKGLCGIRPAAGRWIRPLLCLTRGEAEGYLKELGIRWREDATNAEDDYTRNRIRHHILPELEAQVNRAGTRHLNELSCQAREVWDYLEHGVDQAWENCVQTRESGGLRIMEKEFRQEHPAVQKQLLHRCIGYVRGQEQDIGAVHVSALEELFGRQCGRSLDLGGGVMAERGYEGVELRRGIRTGGRQRTDPSGAEECFGLKIPGETLLPSRGWKITCRFIEDGDMEAAKEFPQKSYTKWIDYDIIKCTLCARTRRGGDCITLDENGSRQKLKSYFINEKIPREDRDKMLLIADGEHIVWIPGRRLSRAYHVSSTTKKILEINITEE